MDTLTFHLHVLALQYLFRCIEEGAVRPPRPELDELVLTEHLMVFNFSEKNYDDAALAIAREGQRTPLSYDAAAKEVNRARAAQREILPGKEYWIPSETSRGGTKAGASSSSSSSRTVRVKDEVREAQLEQGARRKEDPAPVRTSARLSSHASSEPVPGNNPLLQAPVYAVSSAVLGTDSLAAASSAPAAMSGRITRNSLGGRQASAPETALGTSAGTGSIAPPIAAEPAVQPSRRSLRPASSEGGGSSASKTAKAARKAERRAAASLPAPLHKHSLRDGKGKFKPLWQLQAERLAASQRAGEQEHAPSSSHDGASVQEVVAGVESSVTAEEVAEMEEGEDVRTNECQVRDTDAAFDANMFPVEEDSSSLHDEEGREVRNNDGAEDRVANQDEYAGASADDNSLAPSSPEHSIYGGEGCGMHVQEAAVHDVLPHEDAQLQVDWVASAFGVSGSLADCADGGSVALESAPEAESVTAQAGDGTQPTVDPQVQKHSPPLKKRRYEFAAPPAVLSPQPDAPSTTADFARYATLSPELSSAPEVRDQPVEQAPQQLPVQRSQFLAAVTEESPELSDGLDSLEGVAPVSEVDVGGESPAPCLLSTSTKVTRTVSDGSCSLALEALAMAAEVCGERGDGLQGGVVVGNAGEAASPEEGGGLVAGPQE
jgi:hypothetical protein